MQFFTNQHISIATATDASGIVHLLNSAYRGESSRQGWTTEAHLIGGDTRTDEASVLALMQAGSVFLKYTTGNSNLDGCVNLQVHDKKIYLGMLSVTPLLQDKGIGRQLLEAAEGYARSKACTSIYMTVITARTELVNWYMRHGYADTGKRKPFEEDGKTGKHLQPLEFMILEKTLL